MSNKDIIVICFCLIWLILGIISCCIFNFSVILFTAIMIACFGILVLLKIYNKCFSNWLELKHTPKDSLRDKCIEAYGEEFGELYDAINKGEAIGGFAETVAFLDMLEAVKRGKPIDLNVKSEDNNKESYPRVTGVFIPGQHGESDINITIDENGNTTKTIIN